MTVAIYVRVSTTDQTTLNQQIELVGYCERNGLEVYRIYKDEGVSGIKTSRIGLDLMLTDLRCNKFDTVLVWKLDRLGRSVQHLLQILQEFRKNNVRLISANNNIDTSTAQGIFFFTVVSAFAELERDIITERIRLGMDRKIKEGFKFGRPKGSKDKQSRRKVGYWLRYATVESRDNFAIKNNTSKVN